MKLTLVYYIFKVIDKDRWIDNKNTIILKKESGKRAENQHSSQYTAFIILEARTCYSALGVKRMGGPGCDL